MCLGVKVNKDLIGNIMILLAERCKPLHHLSLLKLLYLIDEKATIETGAPITWLEYNVWNLGPVPEDVFYSKQRNQNKFSNYISFKKEGHHHIINPIKGFNDSSFSESDLSIIDSIIQEYGKLSPKELVAITHDKNKLWAKAIDRYQIKFDKLNQTSDYSINFADLIEEDSFKKTIYYAALESVELASTLS